MKLKKLTRHAVLAGAVVITASAVFPAMAQTGQTPNSTVRPGSSAQPDMMQPGGNAPQPGTTNRPGAGATPASGTVQPGTVQPGNSAPATGSQTTNDSELSELLQQVSQTGSFTTLARAVEASGLNSALSSENGSFTILAPTDDAFAALPQDKLQRLLQPENRTLLQRLLAYHVIPGTVTSSQLQTGSLRTLGGGVAVRVTSENIMINNASVVQPDIQAENGVVHVVSQVLMPEELRQQILDL